MGNIPFMAPCNIDPFEDCVQQLFFISFSMRLKTPNRRTLKNSAYLKLWAVFFSRSLHVSRFLALSLNFSQIVLHFESNFLIVVFRNKFKYNLNFRQSRFAFFQLSVKCCLFFYPLFTFIQIANFPSFPNLLVTLGHKFEFNLSS